MRWLGPSRNPPAVTDMASRVEVTTSCSVTPLARRRSGSTSTCSCRSRCPQIATFATPGTAISRGRTVHRASVVRSICESDDDDMPIFMTRLSEDSGDMMTGGCAAAGSVGRHARETLLDELPRRNALGAVFEDQDDRRQAEHGLGPEHVEAGHAVHRRLERHADQRLDVGAGEPGRFGLDLDQRRGELGKHVERGVVRGPDADGHQDDRERHHRQSQPQRSGNQCAHHAGRPAYFPTPNSVPNSSAAPSVTTRVPAGGPCRSTAVSPTISASATRWRTNVPPSRAS